MQKKVGTGAGTPVTDARIAAPLDNQLLTVEELFMTQEIEKLVFVEKNRVLTTSFLLAEGMGIAHKDVIKEFLNLSIMIPEGLGPEKRDFFKRNFIIVEAADKSIEMITMTHAGFTMLAMGINTPQAIRFRIKIANEFEDAEHSNQARLVAREHGKKVRRAETDTIKIFIEYCRRQGSKNSPRYYEVFTKLSYRQLHLLGAGMAAKDWDNFRDTLSAIDLGYLMVAEQICGSELREGMRREIFYKEISKQVKEAVMAYAATVPAGNNRGLYEDLTDLRIKFLDNPDKRKEVLYVSQ